MSVLNIQLIKHYGKENLEFEGDCDTELIVDGKIIICGDEYHDHVDDQIKGFFTCLGYFNTRYKRRDINLADSDVW